MPENDDATRPTPVALLEREVRRFLSTPQPEVICIGGHWGVGKTFAWNRFLQDAQKREEIALKRYSYVSLFGVNTLEEFRYSIFENSVQSSAIGCKPSLATLQTNTADVLKGLGKKSFGVIQRLPSVQNYVGGLGPLAFLSVKDMIVCIDDIERHGDNLRVIDVLGLVSALKEQKRCKVVLILNDEALESETDKPDFHQYLEKVVDTFLKFAPTAAESVGIALDTNSDTNKWLSESCVTPGISNIRVIRKIESAIAKIEPLLREYDPQVMNNTVRSLTLLGWAVHEPRIAPSVAYLEARAKSLYMPEKKEVASERETAWNALLEALSFTLMDEYDRVLLNGVQNGYFDPEAVRKYASEQDRYARLYKSESSWKEAWGAYHDSFDDNEKEVIEAIHGGFLKDVRHRSHVDLSGAVKVLKALGEPEKAAELIKVYLARPEWTKPSFDLKGHPFGSMLDEPDVLLAFEEKYATFPEDRDATAVMIDIATKHGWSQEDLNIVDVLSVDDYYKMFKEHKGAELKSIIDGCLQFKSIYNSSGGSMNSVAARATEALRRIAQESRVNALRVKKYGVDLSPKPIDPVTPLENGMPDNPEV